MSEPWLLIETSARGGHVGLAVGGSVAASIALDPARRHNRDLAPFAADLLAANGVRFGDLSGVMVSVGPGSYTGLRVGLMSAKALAWAVGCRLVAVPTFAAFAEAASDEFDSVDVIADALQGMVYAQRFRRTATGWDAANDLRIEPATTWAGTAGGYVIGPQVPSADKLLGPGRTRRHVQAPPLDALLGAGFRVAPVSDAELMRLEPLYLRGSSAEENARISASGRA